MERSGFPSWPHMIANQGSACYEQPDANCRRRAATAHLPSARAQRRGTTKTASAKRHTVDCHSELESRRKADWESCGSRPHHRPHRRGPVQGLASLPAATASPLRTSADMRLSIKVCAVLGNGKQRRSGRAQRAPSPPGPDRLAGTGGTVPCQQIRAAHRRGHTRRLAARL